MSHARAAALAPHVAPARRVVLVAVVTLATATAGGAAATASAAQATSPRPAIRFVSLIPARARGTHFAPREQVKVTLRAGAARRSRTARASSSGVFAVGFGTLRERDRCSGSVTLTAAGSLGSRAVYRLPKLVCPTEKTTPTPDASPQAAPDAGSAPAGG